MKKFLALGLTLMLAMGMSACGGSKETNTNTGADTAVETEAPVEEETEAVEEETEAEVSEDEASEEAELTYGYMGIVGDDGTTAYLAMNDDVSICAFVFLSPDATQNVNFIGESEVSEAGDITIHDTTDGVDFTFGAVDNGDGTYSLDMGDLGTALVAECDVNDVIDAINTIGEGTEQVNVG